MRKTILACVAVALITSAATATAATLITGKQIKNGTIQSRDIKKGTISANRLTPRVQALLATLSAQGGAAIPGPAGAKGDTGAPGAKGDTGAPGAKGRDAVIGVTALSSDAAATTGWVGRQSNGCDPSGPTGPISLGDHVKYGPFTDGNMSASLFTREFSGLKLRDIAYLAYTAKYDQAVDVNGGTPYLRVFLENDTHDVIFSPNTQGRTVRSGDWDRLVVTDGTGLRYDDDGGDGSGEYGVSGTDWDTLVADHGGEAISRVVISAGCSGAYSDASSAYIDNLEIDIAGDRKLYDFGT